MSKSLSTELLSLEWLKRHFELKLEPELELEVVVADWLSLATVEAILEFENDVFAGALRSYAPCRHGPFEIHP